MEFFNNFSNLPEPVLWKMDPENMAEQAGWLSPQQVVDQFMIAGQNLLDYRRGLMDMEDVPGSDPEQDGPSSIYEQDPVEVSLAWAQSVARRKEEYERRRNAEQAKTVVEGSSEGSSEGPKAAQGGEGPKDSGGEADLGSSEK